MVYIVLENVCLMVRTHVLPESLMVRTHVLPESLMVRTHVLPESLIVRTQNRFIKCLITSSGIIVNTEKLYNRTD